MYCVVAMSCAVLCCCCVAVLRCVRCVTVLCCGVALRGAILCCRVVLRRVVIVVSLHLFVMCAALCWVAILVSCSDSSIVLCCV